MCGGAGIRHELLVNDKIVHVKNLKMVFVDVTLNFTVIRNS